MRKSGSPINRASKKVVRYTGNRSTAHIMGALVVHSSVEIPQQNNDQNTERTATYIAKLTNTSN